MPITAPAARPFRASQGPAVTTGASSAPAVGGELPKYMRVAARIRGQIADGTLRPGQPAPSGAALSRATGFSTLTCRKALRVLLADGVLVPGTSRNGRPRVAGGPQPTAERDLADATAALSGGLAVRRRAAGLTQPELAALTEVSVTTIGHAETGRIWQSRKFWERADAVLDAAGELLRLHDAYRSATVPVPQGKVQTATQDGARGPLPQAAVQERDQRWQPVPACIMIVWPDGTVTEVRPPGTHS